MKAKWQFLACMLSSTGLSLSADDKPDIEIQPVSVRVNYEKEETYVTKINPGTEVGVYVKLPNGIDFESVMGCKGDLSREKDVQYDHNALLLRDSNVKNLGKYLGCRDKGKTGFYYFSFENRISPGAKSLHLTGEVPVELRMKNKMSDTVAIDVEEGKELELSGYRIVLFDASERRKQEKKAFQDEDRDEKDDEYKYKVAFFIQLRKGEKAEGLFSGMEIIGTDDSLISFKEGDTFKEGTHYTKKQGETWDFATDRVYLFTELPKRLDIALKYRPVETFKIPLDVKFDLHPLDVEVDEDEDMPFGKRLEKLGIKK